MTPSPPPPPGFADPLRVSISSIKAALEKLDIGIPVEDVVKAVQAEEAAQLATHPTTQYADTNTTLVPCDLTQRVKERRRRLMELTREAFPDGKVPAPYYWTHN
ncbi:hypothetical protein R3P38DRAFT_59184 [Favolaschia claudopus]|uniref:Uncharacterized protein n=1 Tax=Favolaschia claudopus TaxID=2862362 RepID=A0AAW0EL91_9AGAR